MTLYFGQKKPITEPYDVQTQWMIKNKAPLIRSQILTQRSRQKVELAKLALKDMFNRELKRRINQYFEKRIEEESTLNG